MARPYKKYQVGDLIKCNKCEKAIVATESMVKNGHYSCKSCHSKRVTKSILKNIESTIRRNKKFLSTEKGKAMASKVRKRYRAANKEKYKAHWTVSHAIRSGKLIKGSCEVCGATKAHAHHDDYSKPLEVRWLCPKCHVSHHRLLLELSKPQP